MNFFPSLLNALSGGAGPGPDLGPDGHWRVHHVQSAGPGRSDRGRHHVHRRRGLHHAHDPRRQRLGGHALRVHRGHDRRGSSPACSTRSCGIPAILAGILTQLALFSMNLRIMGGKANQAINPDKYDLLVSLR